LLVKGSLHWEKPVNEATPRDCICPPEGLEDEDEDEFEDDQEGINPFERRYRLYRSDRPIGPASLRATVKTPSQALKYRQKKTPPEGGVL
jgi:hypothetical protein